MRLSLIVCAVALGALASTDAYAKTLVKLLKSNSSFKLAPGDAAAEKACIDKQGTVFTDAAGNKFCVLPPPPPPAR